MSFAAPIMIKSKDVDSGDDDARRVLWLGALLHTAANGINLLLVATRHALCKLLLGRLTASRKKDSMQNANRYYGRKAVSCEGPI
jgi:hypothetical protein